MAGGSGLAGLAVTGLVAALVAFGVTALFSPDPKPAPGSAPAGKDVEDLRREVERLRREVADAKSGIAARAADAAPGTEAGATTASAAAPDTAKSSGADLEGPLPADRKELVALIDRRVAEKAGHLAAAAAPRKRVSIEEAGAEMGLSSVDVDSVKRIWRDSEQELITTVMGTPDMDVVKEELRSAKEDPDRKAALINKAMANGLRNFGRIATLEDRRNKDLKRFLTEEQLQKLKSYDIKSAMDDPDLEKILEDLFD